MSPDTAAGPETAAAASPSRQNAGHELVIRDVRKRFAGNPALGPISVVFEPGQFVAIVGESGCGKTTLLRLIGGLLPFESGEIIYHGQPVTEPPDGLGMAFQQAGLLDWMTALRNVTLQLEVRKVGSKESRRARGLELLDQVGLAGLAGRRPFQLSGGQQQRVALCRALANDPDLLLMDEPFGAVDALTRERLQADLERLWMQRRPNVVLVTHSVTEAVMLADRVIILKGPPGRMVADIAIDVPHPRRGTKDEGDPKIAALCREVHRWVGSQEGLGE